MLSRYLPDLLFQELTRVAKHGDKGSPQKEWEMLVTVLTIKIDGIRKYRELEKVVEDFVTRAINAGIV